MWGAAEYHNRFSPPLTPALPDALVLDPRHIGQRRFLKFK